MQREAPASVDGLVHLYLVMVIGVLMPMTRALLLHAACLVCMTSPVVARAQRLSPRKREFWVAGSLTMAITLPLDERIREFAAHHQSAAVDRIAQPLDLAGRPRDILPVLVAGALVPRIVGDAATSNAALDIGVGYAVATTTGSLLRRAIGRHRPDTAGQSLKFSPLRRLHEWHSFPSGHVVGVMALATGISMKANRPWVTSVTYGMASMVGLQRIYNERHWASDVVAGTLFGIAVGASTVRWREHQRSPNN